eukprot:INCI8287.11.p2 GENE.INCI8287.11~~INCI8287.11.p2  ORF type:complete len:429 (+),score=119.76 INCI8287.11:83-1288(+)
MEDLKRALNSKLKPKKRKAPGVSAEGGLPLANDPAAQELEREKKKKQRERQRNKKKKKRKKAQLAAAPEKENGEAKGGTSAAAAAGKASGAPKTGRTVSIALPGSIVDNCQSRELQSYVAGQIARAAAIFQIDEVVIFNDSSPTALKNPKWNPNVFLARIMQYLETPQYLRKALFPMHPDLKYAGLLNPLDTPHHMRMDEPAKYREAVVLKRPIKEGKGSFVNAGLKKDVQIQHNLPVSTRLTVRMLGYKGDHRGEADEQDAGHTYGKKGLAVPPSQPKQQDAIFWGYQTRIADSISAVFTESPFEQGYDLTIGTSERGDYNVMDPDFKVPPFQHALVLFGGVEGLEVAVGNDERLSVAAADTKRLFDMWVNTCPFQGSRTIRTEEAIFISLASLGRHLFV